LFDLSPVNAGSDTITDTLKFILHLIDDLLGMHTTQYHHRAVLGTESAVLGTVRAVLNKEIAVWHSCMA